MSNPHPLLQRRTRRRTGTGTPLLQCPDARPLVGDCESPRRTPTSCGRQLLRRLVLAAERIAASDPPRPSVRATQGRRRDRRDASPGAKAGV